MRSEAGNLLLSVQQSWFCIVSLLNPLEINLTDDYNPAALGFK